jgi:GDP-4-dehydro-6-deoxy-D-mannose reductase
MRIWPDFESNDMTTGADALTRAPIRVVVTGSSGFVGQWLVRRLREPEFSGRISVFPLFDQTTVGPQSDITTHVAVENAIARLKPDCVVHLAAVANPTEGSKNPRRMWDVNLFGTFNVAHAILRQAPDARLIFASSADVYGTSFNTCPLPISEEAVVQPLRSYGASKLAAECLLNQLSHDGLDVVLFRPFNHTGPGQSPAYAVSSFARQIANIEAGLAAPVLKVGNLDAERDFLDVRDVVDAYTCAITQTNRISCQPINLATGFPTSIGSILEAMLGMSASKIEVRVDPDLVRKSEIPIMSGSTSRAKAELGWTTRIPLKKTIEDVLNYWRSRPPGFQ